MTTLQIWNDEPWLALPEDGCFSRIIARRKLMFILPDTADTNMILKLLPDTRKVLHERYTKASQLVLVADPR